MLSDRSVLSGLGDLVRVLSSSEGSIGKQAGKLTGRIATSFFLPAAARDYREMADPYRRSLDVPDTLGSATWTSVVKSTMNAVPFLSENLPPLVDAFGKDMISTGGFLYRGLVPVRRGEIKQDPVAVALMVTATPVNKPDYLIGLPNSPKIDLLQMDDGAGWVYRKYQQKVGELRYRMLKQLTESAGWRNEVEKRNVAPDSVAGDMVRKIVREARRAATLEFINDIANKQYIQPRVAGENVGERIKIKHVFSKGQYADLAMRLKKEGPTKEVMEEVRGAGLKYSHKPIQRGLPKEMQLPDF